MTLKKTLHIGYTEEMAFRQRSAGTYAIYVTMLVTLLLQNSPIAFALTYDIENNIGYETIDEIDGTTDMGLRFGGSANKTLKYERTLGQFAIDDDIRITGNVVSTGTLSGSMISVGGVAPSAGVLKVASGAILNADMDSNDTLLVFGNIIGPASLKFINAVQEFEFNKGIRVNGAISGSGNLAIENNATIDDTTFYVDSTNNRVGIGTNKNPETPLEVIGTTSGRVLRAQDSLLSSGSLVVRASTAGSMPTLYASGSTKKVGIRTGTPGSPLSVSGSVIFSPNGNLGSTAADAGIALEITGTASGADILAQKSLRSSGSLVVDGSSIFEGALTFGDVLGDAVTVNAATWTFVNDTNFVLSGGVNGLSFDTNTLSIDATGDQVGIGTTAPKTKLEIAGTASGQNLFATKSVSGANLYAATTIGGAGLTNCTGTTAKLTWLASIKQFACETDETGGGASGIVDHYVRAGGDTMTGGLLIESRASGVGTLGTVQAGVLLEVGGTASGIDLFATKSLRSSGSLVVRPTGQSVPTLFANGTQKVGIRTGTPGSQLAVSGSVIFSPNGNLGSTAADVGIALEITGTASGADILAQKSLRSSGSLVVDGSSIFEGALTFGDVLGDAVTINAATWTFANDTNFVLSGGVNGLSFDTNTLSIDATADRVGIGNTTPKVKLEVTGTSSGTNLYASNSLTGSHLYAATTFGGAGLSDCDTGASSKLLWSADTKQFSCGTDQGGAGGGISYAEAVSYFVDDSGDTMTGGLLIESRASGVGTPGTIQAGVLLEVGGTASGADIFAQKSLRSSGALVIRPSGFAKPTLFANGTQKVGIMTGSPHSTLTSSGSFATTQRIMTATGSIDGTHQVIFASGSSPITLTLPTAVGINGRQYTIKKSDTALNNFVTIATTSSQLIDGMSSWILYNRGQQVTVVSTGAHWHVLDDSAYGVNGYRARGTTLNQWYTSPLSATALASTALTATAAIRTMPFVVEKTTTIDAMAVSVVTTAASSTARLGIFRDNGNAYPGKLISDVGTVTTDVAGARSICPSGCTTTPTAGTLPVTLQPGLYWLAIHHSAHAYTIRGFAVAGVIPILGFPTALGAAPNLAYISTSAQAAFPVTFPGGATLVTAAPLPAIFVRQLY